ncbi:MAG: tetratricopeptide repeat protein [Planctomycetes bacterium]|nr:tetratricopeptide repeat protein [Planctomycetota bacterium]
MTPPKSVLARQIFEDVVDLESDARTDAIAQRCGNDTELRELVLDLLRADAEAESGQFLARTVSADLTGAKIGKYTVLRALGSGGMGTVYLAEQDQPKRQVALKVLQPIFRSSSVLRRFTVESEILARLSHPSIAQVFDAGVHEFDGDGIRLTLPWYALEYLEHAAPLTHYAQQHGLDTIARVQLMATIGDAVHHAHRKGVIHRDLKPANLLVDGGGHVKVIDFGVARVASTDGASTLHTQSGELLGTVRYMAPEQLAGDSDAVDTRSDVYALGVILFELLCGKPPLDLDGKNVSEAARIARDVEPKRLRSIAPALAQDLEWICAKALEKDPARRFASAGEFAADLERFLAGEPTLSGPPSATYRVGVFVRRHRALVASTLAVIVALAIGLAVALKALQRANAEETRANREAKASKESAERAELAEAAAKLEAQRALDAEASAKKDANIAQAIKQLLTDSYAQANAENRGLDLKVVDALESTTDRMFDAFLTSPEVIAPVSNEIARLYQSLGDRDRALDVLARATTMSREANVVDGRDYAVLLSNQVELMILAGRIEEALTLLDDADAVVERAQALDPSVRLRGARQRGSILQRLGRLAEAEPALERALAEHESALGEDNIDALIVANDLALVRSGLNRLAESVELQTTVVERARAAFGDDNVWTLSFRGNLAAYLRDSNRLDEAIAELHDIVRIQSEKLGAENPYTLSSRAALAKCMWRKQDREAAVAEYRDVVEIRTRVTGAGDPTTLNDASSLANALSVMGRFDESETVAKRHLEAGALVLPSNHPSMIGLSGTLGFTYLEQKNTDAAEPLLLGSHDGFAATFGKDSPYTLRYAQALVHLYELRGDSAKADLYRRTPSSP